MRKIFALVVLFVIAYINISCSCLYKESILEEYIKSDVVFKGILIHIDTIEVGINEISTFERNYLKLEKNYKSKNQNDLNEFTFPNICHKKGDTLFIINSRNTCDINFKKNYSYIIYGSSLGKEYNNSYLNLYDENDTININLNSNNENKNVLNKKLFTISEKNLNFYYTTNGCTRTKKYSLKHEKTLMYLDSLNCSLMKIKWDE